MPMPMDALLEEVSRDHFPNPPATPEEIEEFERRMGWKLDPDLRAFYLHCNGASMIELDDSPYRILSLAEIVRGRVAIFGKGEDTDEMGPASQYAICYVGDGNYVMADVGRQQDGRYPLIDGFHETWPKPEYSRQIASSFSEFLENILRTRRSLYWLKGGAAHLPPEPELESTETEPLYYGGLTRADLLRGMGIDPETLEPMKEVPEEVKRRWPYPYQGD